MTQRKVVAAVLSLVIFCFLTVLPTQMAAQQTASLTGVVTDGSGAVIPGVEVSLVDTQTGATQNATTNELGVYLFVRVRPAGGYTLTFTKEGFKKHSIVDVAVTVNTTGTRNAMLEIGEVSAVVTVESAGATTINTTDATIGNAIETRRIQDLPLSLRNSPARLLGLQPGVVANTGGGANRDGAVTGARTDQGNITLDGLDVNDMAGGFAFTVVGQAPIDTIQEFRTVSANPAATDGRSGGAQITLVTKSGTNDWHGSARYFWRHEAFAANSFFNNKAGTPRPTLRRHQFGGNYSGPILRDRLFFFSDYEARRQNSQFTNQRTAPLQHVFNGSVAYVNDGPGCGASSTLQTAPSCVTILTPAEVAMIDPAGIGAASGILSTLSSRYPVGQLGLGGNGVNTGGIRFNSPVTLKDNIWTNRVDFTAGSHRLFGRFNIQRFEQDRTDGPIQQFPGDEKSTNSTSRDWSYAIGHTWTINSNAVNQATFGITKQVFAFNRTSRPSFPNSFTFSGLSAPFVGLSSQGRDVPVPTIRDDFNYLKGNHNFQMGGSFKPIRQKSQLTNDFNFVTVGLGGLTSALCGRPVGGGQCAGGTTTTGNHLRPNMAVFGIPNIADSATSRGQWDSMFTFLTGRFASISTSFNYDPSGAAFAPGTGKNRNFAYNEYEAYFQDTWRVRQDLTLTFGVRWAYYSVPYEVNGFQASNDIDFGNLITIRALNAANGVSGPNAEPFLRYDLAGQGNNAAGYSEPDLNNWAPRFSLAYNPSFREGPLGWFFGDRKTSVRLGGAVTYDRVAGAITFIQDQVSYLFDNSSSTSFGDADPFLALLNDPRFTSFSSLPVTNAPPVITRPFTPFVDSTGFPTGNQTGEFNFAIPRDFRTPYSYVYDLSVQRELPARLFLEVSYVGRLGRKLFSQGDAAQVFDFRDNASGQFMIQAFNALQAEILAGGAITPQPWFENQIGAGGTTLVAGALGSLVEIGDTSDTIQALYGAGLLDANVGLSGQFSTNIYNGNFASSTYQGMLVSLRRQFSQGLQFDLNYTWSHSIDNQSSVTNTVAGGLICDLRNLRVCRGNSDFDVRHIINSNWIYELPFGRGRAIGRSAPTWLDQFIGGWEVAGIYTWRTGFAFRTTTGSFPVGFNFNSPGVLIGPSSALKGNIHSVGSGSTSTIQFFADPTTTLAAFRNPTHGEIGNRNNLSGPGFWNVDLGVLKRFRMPWSESHRLTFRWEAFNAFNHVSFLEPNANINSSQFGNITGERSSPREMQFALRYDF